MGVKNTHAERLKGSCATLIDAGLVGSKARLKSVVDGKQVNIPVLLVTAMEGRRRLGQLGVGCPSLRW